MGGVKSILFGTGIVLIVAAGKTAIVSAFLLGDGLQTFPVVSALFAVFVVLTGIVAVVLYRFLQNMIASKHFARKLSAALQEPGKENLIETYARDWGLTKAETEVAILVVKGFSNAEIAKIRGSVLSTVKTQLGSIYNKSGLANRYQLIAFITDEVCEAAKSRQGDESVKPHRAHLKIVSKPDSEMSGSTSAEGQGDAKTRVSDAQVRIINFP